MLGGPAESNLSQRRKDFEQFQSYLTFSQESSLQSIPFIVKVISGNCHLSKYFSDA
jgi:hypothetical protein